MRMLKVHPRRATPTRFDLDQMIDDLNGRFGGDHEIRKDNAGQPEFERRLVLRGESVVGVTSKLLAKG